MSKFGKKKYLIAGAAAIAIAGAATGAYAYWSSTGTGTGSSTTGTSTNFVVTVDSTTTGDLTPGGATDIVTFHVKNPGTGFENLINTVASVVSTSNGGCTAGDFAVGTPVITYGEIAPTTTVDGSFSLQMKDNPVNQDACKGVTVNLKVAAS